MLERSQQPEPIQENIHGRNPRSNGKILLTTGQVFANPCIFDKFYRQGNVK
jgi:hypothetical protein